MSLATIAIRKNFMTIKQVNRVLDLQEANPQRSFVQIAIEEDLIDCTDADLMLHEQQMSCPTLQKLVVECGLLTQRQSDVLHIHFEKQTARKAAGLEIPMAKPAAAETPVTASEPSVRTAPRQPKFSQRPVIVQPYSNQTVQ